MPAPSAAHRLDPNRRRGRQGLGKVGTRDRLRSRRGGGRPFVSRRGVRRRGGPRGPVWGWSRMGATRRRPQRGLGQRRGSGSTTARDADAPRAVERRRAARAPEPCGRWVPWWLEPCWRPSGKLRPCGLFRHGNFPAWVNGAAAFALGAFLRRAVRRRVVQRRVVRWNEWTWTDRVALGTGLNWTGRVAQGSRDGCCATDLVRQLRA